METPRYNSGMTRTQLFIQNVNSVMQADGVKLKDLADATGIHAKDLSRLLNGRIGSCTIDRADSICKSLGFSWEELTSENFSLTAA